MPTYKLIYRKSVAKDLRGLPLQHRRAIVKRIEALSAQPRPPGSIKLHGGQNLYRFRYAVYRVIYQIDEGQVTILIIKIGHRRDVYRKL